MGAATALKSIASSRGQHIAARSKGQLVILGSKRRISATRAKVLDEDQFGRVLERIDMGRYAIRDTALVMLSFYCGLRPHEIAGLRWKRNVFDAEGKVGDTLHITEDIGKRVKERFIPMNVELRSALRRLRRDRPDDVFVIHALTERYTNSRRAALHRRDQVDSNTLVQYLGRLYKECGFVGCTSYSGRRTFGTNLSRRCNEAGASLRDVQLLMGHKSLHTLEPYLEPSRHQRALVEMVF